MQYEPSGKHYCVVVAVVVVVDIMVRNMPFLNPCKAQSKKLKLVQCNEKTTCLVFRSNCSETEDKQ